jgi:serine/threonine-protein kinase
MPVCGKCHREAPEGALFCSFCGGAIKPVTAAGEAVDPLIGQTLAGKYFIHQLLGHGGMGDVYKATHLTLDRPVVLKLLKKLFHSDPSLVQRFHREARASSRLNHPNSITIIDFGQTDDGTLFMAMEYLSGKSLERIVAEEHPLPEGRVIHIVAQILAALGEAHSLGIIHRDLKPANVMIEPRRDEPDFVKVLDFGIAKLNEPGSGGPGLTQAGIVCGTPGYMSPEQVRGEELDPRSDIYAVGVILYEMLTGVLPFESDTPMGLVTKHLVEDPPPIAVRRPGTVVSEELEAVIMRALARDRDQRFSSSDEMRAALLACGAPVAQSMRPTPAPSSTMIFDPASIGGAGAARPPTGPARTTGPQKTARPTPMRSFTEALPATPGEVPSPEAGAGQPPPSAPARAVSSPRMGAQARTQPPVQKTPAPGPVQKTPAPAPRASAPVQKTPAPARKPPAPAKRTPMPARAPQRTPAPRHEMDEVEAEGAAEQAAAAPSRSKLPIVAGGGVAAAVLVALVVWGVTRPKSEPVPEPRAERPASVPSPAPQAPVQPQPEPPPAVAQPSPQPTPEPTPAAPRPEPTVTAEPPPPVARPEPIVPAKPAPPPRPAPVEARPPRVAAAAKGVRFVKPELNSIPTPAAATGEGVLAVVATPWAEVQIDGREIGETPREILLGAGSYRLRATHPALGTREQTVTIRPGKRVVWAPTFTN